MARPIWKGHVTFGLVMFPVTLYSGEEHQQGLDLDMLDDRDLSPIKYQRVNASTGKEVPWKHIVKGVKQSGGEYVVLEPEDYKLAARDVVKGDVEITEFAELEEINPLLFEKPYYLMPGAGSTKVYNLFREVLKKSKRVGIAHTVIQTRQHLAAIMPVDKVLALMTMRFAGELRDPPVLEAAKASARSVSAAELTMATKLVGEMTVPFDINRHHDRYYEALKKVIAQKASGKRKELPAAEEEDIPETYNIMDLLRRSMSEHRPRPKEGGARRGKGRGQRKAG